MKDRDKTNQIDRRQDYQPSFRVMLRAIAHLSQNRILLL
ncbi:MAG: hypothetical protein RLZZ535_663 [Cyanobacteriota bacterium]|jgi:hypothetical protein